MRRVHASPTPDAPTRLVTLPASWDDSAAAALGALAPGKGPARLADAAVALIEPLAAAAAARGLEVPLGERLHFLLLTRRGAADAAMWSGRASGPAGFVLNLAAFADPHSGFLSGAFGEAVEAATLALALGPSETRRPALRLADLAGLLAVLGLDYDSRPARELGAEIARLLRVHLDTATRLAKRLEVAAVLAPPGPAEALLGVENGGIAPMFSPIRADGSLTRGARAWLAARGISAEAALARTLGGQSPFVEVAREAHAAMRERMLPFFDSATPLPEWAPASPGAKARAVPPSPARGYMQKVSVGGHKVYVRTGEYADGRLAEVAITAARQGPLVRALLEALGGAVSTALQHGVPLSEFAEAFLGDETETAVAVEGDPLVPRARSPLDYVFRNLAANYLPPAELPPLPENASEPPREEREAAKARALLLPLDLPIVASPEERRRALRLVAK